jgi:hypothetical protein
MQGFGKKHGSVWNRAFFMPVTLCLPIVAGICEGNNGMTNREIDRT